eukprot:11798-Heterococcus_DN1.PRE.2
MSEECVRCAKGANTVRMCARVPAHATTACSRTALSLPTVATSTDDHTALNSSRSRSAGLQLLAVGTASAYDRSSAVLCMHNMGIVIVFTELLRLCKHSISAIKPNKRALASKVRDLKPLAYCMKYDHLCTAAATIAVATLL